MLVCRMILSQSNIITSTIFFFTLLLYCVFKVRRNCDSLNAYYSSKPPETIKIARNSMTDRADIHMIPERRMCIVDL